MSHKQDSYQLSRLLEDSISSLLNSNSTDPLNYLTTHFKHQQTPNTPSHVCFKLAQHPHTHPAFSNTCYEIYSQCKDIILEHSGVSRDTFLSQVYSQILTHIPMELSKILTSHLKTIPPSDFESFAGNIKACYTYETYVNNASTLYTHLCAGRDTPRQEDMLEAIDTLNGEFAGMRDLSDLVKCALISLAQGLTLKGAGIGVSRKDFTQTLAALFLETL